MNSKIEKQAKKNLNEIDSYENLMSANNNFLQDLYNDQSTKNARMSSELSGWQNSESFHKQVDFQDRQARFDSTLTNNNESNIISDRQSKRAISANFNVGQTPLISRRKITKHQAGQFTYGSSQKQSKNDISSEILPQATQQSCNQKINSFSSPQVLLSTFIGSNQKFSSSHKQNQDQYVSPFEINTKQFEQNDQVTNNQQGVLSSNQENALKNTVSEWKNYLDRYDSSQDLYNVHLKKRRASIANQHEAQLSEEREKVCNAEEFGEIDRNNILNQLLRQNKLKNNNLSIDISQIKICASNNQSFVEESQIYQQQLQNNNGYQVNSQYPTNYSQNNQKELSSRNTYRTSKSSQANRIFGKKKKSRVMNMSAIHSNQNTSLLEYQINNQIGQSFVSKNNLFNSLIEENQISSSSLNENQNKINLYQYQPQNISNTSSQTALKQKNNQNVQSLLLGKQQEKIQQTSQFSSLNPNISSNAYHPQEFLSSKNTLACMIQGNYCTTPQNKYLENQDLKSMFHQILNKTKEEKEVIVSNKSQILKSVSNNYQPKRSQNFSSANAAYHLGKEKIKQVIQQKNNQIALKQQQNTLNNNIQSLNSNQNQGIIYQNNFCINNIKQVVCENNLFKIIRNNKDLKEDQNIKNDEKVQKFIHQSNNKNQNQIILKQKQQDENNSQPNYQKSRAKSVINDQQPENQKSQDHQAIFSNKKFLYEQANRILKPTVQNILAVSNENSINNNFKICNVSNHQQVKFQEKQSITNNNNVNLRELSMLDKKFVNETNIQKQLIHTNILPIKI
ncbi:hypothetical protein ABPG74_022043 [Tetrahymena malaccensis]